ncbi:MAG: DUF4912 domain-containing protein [Cyanobacteria bacterium J06592_8]
MARSRKALLQIPVVLLALASTPGLFAISVSTFINPVTAQSSDEELTEEERTLTLPETFDSTPSFTVPQSLAEDTEVTVNGSSSMIGLNRVLEERFEERFPNSDVELSATGTPGALEAVRNGDLDIAAVGRLLTQEEKDAGLVAVPVGREKLAIIVSPDNPFDGNLTFEQFAQIFRGEITNWSEIGGPDQEIEFVDRPDDSDTRFALSTYDVFEVAPFETGFNTTQVNEDTTDAVVAELGDNGIGYAIADQVVNRDDIKIISMHQTLPDDPRYPYSQYRSYVYNENNTTPAVVAFLGLASTTPSEAGAAGVAPTAIPRGEDDEEVVPVVPVAPVAGSESDPASVAQVPSAAPIAQDETGGFPWWLLLLLGIPLIGGLLLWLLKGGQGTPIADTAPPPTTGTTPPPTTGTTPPPTTGIGTATPPPPTTGIGVATPPPTTGAVIPPVTETPPPVTGNGATPVTTPPAPPPVPPVPPAPPTPSPVTTTPPTTGGISIPPGLGAIAGVGGLAAAGAAAWWAGREPDSRITLAPGNGQEAYAYWNVPDGDKNFAKENGGRHPQLRMYDVTGIEDPDRQKPSKVQKYDWDEVTRERQVTDLEGNRDYLAEIGYETDDARWLMLARSNQIHIPEREIPTAGVTPGVRAVIPALLGAGGAAALIPMLTRFGSHITLKLADTPTSAPLGTSQTGEAYWEVPNDAIRAAKNNGGQYPQVRLCDVTGLDDLDREQPHYIDKYDWDEVSQTQIFPDLERDRTYLAEIGYETDDEQWLRLARSNRVTIPSVDRFADNSTPNVELVPGLVGAGVIGVGGAAALIPLLTSHGSHIKLGLTDTPQTGEATWDVPDMAKTITKEHGGQYPQVRLCDVTDIDDLDRQTPNNIQKYDWNEVSTNRVFPSLEPDRTYLAEIGYETEEHEWLRLARSNRVTVPAETTDVGIVPGLIGLGGIAAILPVLTRYGSHITLRLIDTPETAEAYWEVPNAAKAKAKEYGGQYPQVRLCDVTDIDDVDRQTPNDTQKYSWDEFSRNRVFPNLDRDRTYLAEIGYETNDEQWLRLARSNRVTVPAETPDLVELLDGGPATVIPPVVETPDVGIVPGLIGLGGIAAILPVLTRYGSHITLSLTDTPQTAEAYWKVPTEAKAKAKEYGGLYPQVRLCDVTDIDDVDRQTPNNIQKYEWNEWTQRQQFPNLEPDRIYLAEIGYETDDAEWLRVARSNRVTIPVVVAPTYGTVSDIGDLGLAGVGTVAPPDTETTPDTGIVPGLGVIGLIPILTRYGSHITLRSTDTPKTLTANWEVPNVAKTAAKGYGGQSPQVRLCDVTGIDDVEREVPLDIQKYHWDEFNQEQVFSDLERDRIYLAEIGYETDDEQWLRLARSNRVNIPEAETSDLGLIGIGGQPQIPSSEVPIGEPETPTTAETIPNTGISPGVIGAGLIGLGGAALIPALTRYGSQITLRLTEIPQTAEAAWNVPEGAKNAAKEQGGRQMQLRIYDVTNIADLETQSPNRVRRYDCQESAQERRIPIEDQNCEYLAEIGYITDDGQWLMLARSNRVIVPETVVEAPTQPTETETIPLSSFPSSIVLIPTGEDAIDIRWEIPDQAKEVAKQQGGRKLQLRVYDLTNTTEDKPRGNHIEKQDCDESDWQFRLEDDTLDSPRGERDYLGEIGYETDNGDWIVLACSDPVHLSADLPDAGVNVELLPRERTTPTTSSVTLVPSDNSTANVYWIVPDVVQAEAKRQGGNQFQLHVYDVTDISPESVVTHNVEQYNFDPSLSSPQLLQLEGDREYFAEIGYLTDDGEWLMVARSYRVRIPVATTPVVLEEQPNLELSLPEPAVIPSLDENRCRVSLIPSDNETANVYWEVPEAAIEDVIRRGGRQFQLHIYDVTDIPADSVATHSLQQYDFNVALPHPELLHLEGNHEYFAEIGYLTDDGEWLRLARSYRVRIPAITGTDISATTLTPGNIATPGLGSIAPTMSEIELGRMVLSLEDEGVVEAEWDVSDAAKALAKQQGGYQFQVRAYDVTDTAVETSPSNLVPSEAEVAEVIVDECAIAESISTWEFELEGDREYLAEVGYITEDGRWIVLARSNRLLITVDETEDDSTGSATVAFMGTGETEQPLDESSSYITLSIADDEWVDARWEVPNAVKASAKERGGQKFQLHVYEVTDIDITTHPAHGVQRYNCNELIKQWQVPNLKPNCEYLVEIGYVTDGAEWLMLARSNRVRVPEPTIITRDLTNVSPGEIAPCQITLVVIDNYSADAHWEVPRLAREAAKQQGGRKFQLRIYDVTGIDVETQSATIIRRYNCHELVQQLQIPNLGTNRDYLVEMGYVTDDEQWMILARSNSVRIPGSNATIVQPEATISTPSGRVNLDQVETTTARQQVTTGNCAIQHLTVDSRRNCHQLTSACMKQVEEKAVSLSLEPGIYVLRIKSGTFGYGPTFVGEPFIILWIYGGKVINKKTRVPVAATWSTLNGYHETLTLEVQETSQLSAFFFDTYPDDNEGAVTLSVARLYDAP